VRGKALDHMYPGGKVPKDFAFDYSGEALLWKGVFAVTKVGQTTVWNLRPKLSVTCSLPRVNQVAMRSSFSRLESRGTSKRVAGVEVLLQLI
jgi:hypothetical protein